MIFRSRKHAAPDAAVAEAPEPIEGRSVASLDEEIGALTEADRDRHDPAAERRLMRLRHAVGAQLVDEGRAKPPQPDPSNALPDPGSGLPDVSPEELTPELIRAGILRDGCLLVRGLVDRDEARALAGELQRVFDARDAESAGRQAREGYYEEFVPDPPYTLVERQWVSNAGGVWAADSPRVMFDLLDMCERAGLRQVIAGYLGERAAISVNKSTLRRATPDTEVIWHQDGAFMGDVRALNLWLALSDCGEDAPGLDIVPRRLEHVVPTGTEGAAYDWSVGRGLVEEAAGENGIVSPVFEPGDALFFDHLMLHTSGVEDRMTGTRYAIESWFFGPSGFPGDYVPIAF